MSSWEDSGKSNEWYTPAYIFDALTCRFDMDVAASRSKFSRVPSISNIYENSLGSQWDGFVWMNPPFGKRNGLHPWLQKFFLHGNGIALTPDRTSAPWFQYAWSKCDLVLFTKEKVKFIRPDGTSGNQPGCGTALWASGHQAVVALKHAYYRGLGVLAKPKILPQATFELEADRKAGPR